MFYGRKNYLFSEYSLSEYLRQVVASLDAEVKSLTFEEINKGEDNLVEDLKKKYQIDAPELAEDKIDVDPKEATIRVRDNFGFHDEGFVEVPGLSITVRLPFSGPSVLFRCRASTHSASGTPDADIDGNTLVLNYETREKDPEKIKNLWKGDTISINQNLDWIRKDLSAHNSNIENDIRAAVTRRKKEAGENESLINKLKE